VVCPERSLFLLNFTLERHSSFCREIFFFFLTQIHTSSRIEKMKLFSSYFLISLLLCGFGAKKKKKYQTGNNRLKALQMRAKKSQTVFGSLCFFLFPLIFFCFLIFSFFSFFLSFSFSFSFFQQESEPTQV
jgi:hypothetical protein